MHTEKFEPVPLDSFPLLHMIKIGLFSLEKTKITVVDGGLFITVSNDGSSNVGMSFFTDQGFLYTNHTDEYLLKNESGALVLYKSE